MEQSAALPRPTASAANQTWRFLKNPFDMLQATREECGDIFCLRILGFGDWVFVCSPELAREMFKAPDTQLAAGAVNYDFLGYLLGKDSFFNMDGDAHAHRRRLISPPLIGKQIFQQIDRIRDVTRRVLESWPEGEYFKLLPHTNGISLEIILKALLGELDDERLKRFAHLTHEFFEVGLRSPLVFLKPFQWNLGPWSPWGRVLRMRQELFDALYTEIDDRISGRQPVGGGVLGDLLSRDEDEKLSPEALVHEIVTIAFGAQEATGKILTWAMVGTLHNPQVLERAKAEIDEVLGDEPVGMEHLQKLPYLEAVINEAIRFRPLSPMAGIRLARSGAQLGGYPIPKGTMVSHCFTELSQDADRFPEPRKFDPDRFFEQKMEAYRFNPFGGGVRRCLGKRFAEMEMLVILATLLQRAEFEVASDGLEPVRRGLLFAPDNARVRVLRRL